MKKGLPKKLIVDNGAAYRSLSLQGICARLGINLILGPVTKLDPIANLNRKRQRPTAEDETMKNNTINMVDLAQKQYRERYQLTPSTEF